MLLMYSAIIKVITLSIWPCQGPGLICKKVSVRKGIRLLNENTASKPKMRHVKNIEKEFVKLVKIKRKVLLL